MAKELEKVKSFICQHGLLKEGGRVVVGLSGGPDSVCLALTLHQLGYKVVAAHANFHLRDKESMRDELFVEALCQQQSWTFHKMDFDTEEYARTHQISIEMAARKLRYDWFRMLMEQTEAEAIAVGHHQDDNAETMLLNMTRGTGIKGLCGMMPRNGNIIRPLLCLTRPEILEFLATQQQDHVIDRTNLEDAYARNIVRLNVLPQLGRINPGAKRNIVSTMENLNEVQKVYQAAIQNAIRACCQWQQNGELHIIKYILRQQPSPISVLHEVLSPFGFNKTQMQKMMSALDEPGRVFEAQGRRLLIDRDHLILEAEEKPWPTISQKVFPIEEINILKDPHFAYLDADKLHGPLTLRTPYTGDSFAPFGMGGQRKLLSDYLTDQKLNLFEKERQALLMDGEEIAWVVGRRSSECYRVDDTTRRVMECHMLPFPQKDKKGFNI